MNFQEYVHTVKLRAAVLPHDKQLKHMLIGMITEVGELADPFKKHLVKGKEIDNVNIMEEIGDYLWYFVGWLDEMGVHMRTVDELAAEVTAEYAGKPILEQAQTDAEVLFVVAYWTGVMAVGDPKLMKEKLHAKDVREGLKGVIGLLIGLLQRYGNYTLSNCLERNDAKLGARHGNAFNPNAVKVENRDLAAERVILEGGYTPAGKVVAGALGQRVADVVKATDFHDSSPHN
jgi:NTP pyrophosphatase (non-canonical NTP hydrolase)